MKGGETLWLTVIEHIRSVGAGNIITRQHLLNNVRNRGIAFNDSDKGLTTVDTYRGYLTNAGYLETWKYGAYRINESPSQLLTIQAVKDRGRARIEQILKARLEGKEYECKE